jgi:antitoxin PrlF
MNLDSLLGEKGQVTIPKPLRDSLGLAPGARLQFEEQDGVLLVRKSPGNDPIAGLRGLLPRLDVDAELAASRGPDWDAALDARGSRRR